MAGFWTHRFNVVLRPLRDRTGAHSTIVLEARTAAQATREATIRYPEMKVIQVSRWVEPVPVITPRQAGYDAGEASESPETEPLPAVAIARRA